MSIFAAGGAGLMPMDYSSLMAGAGGASGAGMGGAGAAGGLGGAGGAAGAVLSGIQTLGSLWMAHKAAKLAKKQFKFTKDITNTNLANQIKSYNTALYDRARSRAVMESQTDAERDAYIANNSLSRKPGESHKTDGYTSNYYGATPASTNSASSARPSSSSVSGFAALAARAASEREPERVAA